MQGHDLSPIHSRIKDTERRYISGEYGASNRPFREDHIPVCQSPHSPDFRPHMKVGGWGKMRYIRDRRWKLVAYVDDTWELYDLDSDPGELHNLYGRPENADIASRLTAAMTEQMMRLANPDVQADSFS